MAHRTVEVDIDGTPYTIGTVRATEGLSIVMRMVQLGSSTADGEAYAHLRLRQREEALSTLARRFTERWTSADVDMCKTLLKQVQAFPQGRQGAPVLVGGPAFDEYFAGRYGHMTRLVCAALEHNFSDFPDALLIALAGLIGGAMQTPSPAPTETAAE
jgi:hypothetical protein